MDLATALPATATRVERHTRPHVNERIREQADARVARLEKQDDEAIAERLRQIDAEWDIERLLQLNASVLVMAGTALGASVDRRFLWLPAAVLAFFAQHALQGWCPPIAVMRRLGVRTQREIERERMALKALRGDFDGLRHDQPRLMRRVHAALAAVDS